MITERVQRIFESTVEIVFAVIIFFLAIGIVLGVIQLVMQVWALFSFNGITGRYIDLITDVLTLYVLVELSRSLVEYFNSKTVQLTFVLDAAIVFVLREVLIGVFKHAIATDFLLALIALIFVLGVLRTLTVVFSSSSTAPG